MSLATEIKAARAKLGLSQSQAAKAWGLSLATLQGWEQEYREPRGLAMTKLREIIAAALAADRPAAPASSASPASPDAPGATPECKLETVKKLQEDPGFRDMWDHNLDRS